MIENALPTEDYILYADKSKSMSGLNKRMFFMLPLLVVLFLLSSHFAHGFKAPVHLKTPPYSVRYIQVPFDPLMSGFITCFPWFFLAEVAFLYVVVSQLHEKQTKPIVVLTSEGIKVSTLATHLGLIRWDEIDEVRNYNLIYRLVGIVPKREANLSQRMKGSSALLFRLNAACIPLYKPFGIFVALINIPQLHLSISADELLTKVRTYQAVSLQSANQFHPGLGLPAPEGVWPPPLRQQLAIALYRRGTIKTSESMEGLECRLPYG